MGKKIKQTKDLIPVDRIENKILYLRGQKVMIDYDLAALYGVPTKRLNEQVKRNIARFPNDFMFRLNKMETDILVANCDLKNRTWQKYKIFALRFYRAGCGYAVQRFKKQAGDTS